MQLDSALPFDSIRSLLREMPEPDERAVMAVRQRDAVLTKPPGSLGRLETIVEWMAAWQGRPQPSAERGQVSIFAGNHGVAARGVSAFPPAVTRQMVDNFAAGGAAINQICEAHGLGLKIFDLALDVPTGDITEDAAMDERTCAATMAFGMEGVAGELDLLCIGEMGIGNTTVAAAVFAALFGGTGADWVGSGTGVDQAGLALKAEVVDRALEHHKGNLDDSLEVLRRVGGREIAAMAGAIVAARHARVPVIVDGFVATSAAAVLFALEPGATDHCLFGHVSAEQGHIKALEAMKKTPLLALGMRLGEGTGAALAAGIVRAAVRTHAGMATFAEAGVSDAGT